MVSKIIYRYSIKIFIKPLFAKNNNNKIKFHIYSEKTKNEFVAKVRPLNEQQET